MHFWQVQLQVWTMKGAWCWCVQSSGRVLCPYRCRRATVFDCVLRTWNIVGKWELWCTIAGIEKWVSYGFPARGSQRCLLLSTIAGMTLYYSGDRECVTCPCETYDKQIELVLGSLWSMRNYRFRLSCAAIVELCDNGVFSHWLAKQNSSRLKFCSAKNPV